MMLRAVISAAASRIPLLGQIPKYQNIIIPALNQYHTLNSHNIFNPYSVQKTLLQNDEIKKIANNLNRSVTKFSLKKGKRKTVKAVIKRFYRLDWGIWIRTKTGRHKKLWKKTSAQKRRLRQHVFVNATQSTLLDKMVTKFWKRPKYYVDDPYEPYHQREEYFITRRNPV